MKNINITIFKDGENIFNYVSDVIPNIGDFIEIPVEYSFHLGQDIYESKKSKLPGKFCVVERTFTCIKNQVALSVVSDEPKEFLL
tara:strand:- start:173 stop:427 length:255 start_codon:yes stop_codon:yes gene_type:complete